MSTYQRTETVEAMQWRWGSGHDLPEWAAQRIVAWVNANGGEARYEPLPKAPCHTSSATHCIARYGSHIRDTVRIAVRTSIGWAYAAPGDWTKMCDIIGDLSTGLCLRCGRPEADHPEPGRSVGEHRRGRFHGYDRPYRAFTVVFAAEWAAAGWQPKH